MELNSYISLDMYNDIRGVPGGWIYDSTWGESSSAAFVPEPQGYIEADFPEVEEKLKIESFSDIIEKINRLSEIQHAKQEWDSYESLESVDFITSPPPGPGFGGSMLKRHIYLHKPSDRYLEIAIEILFYPDCVRGEEFKYVRPVTRKWEE